MFWPNYVIPILGRWPIRSLNWEFPFSQIYNEKVLITSHIPSGPTKGTKVTEHMYFYSLGAVKTPVDVVL